MSCNSNNRVNFIAPQYPESCVCPEKTCPPCKPWRWHPRFWYDNYCGTPGNFMFPDCEESCAEVQTAFQDQIICATCIYPIDNVLTVPDAQEILRIEENSESSTLSFKYAGGDITLLGLINEPTSSGTPVGTRRIFLNVPIVLAYMPMNSYMPMNGSGTLNYTQVNATFSALLMPDQCPEVTTVAPNVDIMVKLESASAMDIMGYYIDVDYNKTYLYLDNIATKLTLYFVRVVDRDILVMPSCMPKVECPDQIGGPYK